MTVTEWLSLEDPAPGRYLCPVCRGGGSYERSLAVWTHYQLKIAYCHRSSCHANGCCGNRADMSQEPIFAFTPRVYRGDNFPLSGAFLERFKARFGFEPRMLGQVGRVGYTTPLDQETYILPITRSDGSRRGVMEAVYGGFKQRRIYKEADEPMISWTPGGDNYAGVWIVEDQVSALKLWTIASVRAVALLGTHLSAVAAAEIKAYTHHVTIALDADATAQAFDMARTWGASFKSCRVQILSRDIKDMSADAIREIIYAS